MKRVTVLAVVLTACSTSAPAPTPTTLPSPTSPTAIPSAPSPTPTVTASPLPTSFGGQSVSWPRTSESTPAPPALGAVVTSRVAAIRGGGTLAAGLTLPRTGGTASAPQVMTPCGRTVVLSGGDVRRIPPGNVVVIDPGHGGGQSGAIGPNGDREKVRNLQISLRVRAALAGRVGRVVLTRERDFEATLGFRARLADALNADAAVSVHLNSSPDGPRSTPGTETFGSTADGHGRRFAGLLYEHIRRYVQTLDGPWVGDRDAGAKYRVGRDGEDYYGLLRRAHRPFVITESLYISSRHEEALAARADVRDGIGRAIAEAIVAFTKTRSPGSGWVKPYARPADPPAGPTPPCVDPAR